ncbi:MAG: HAMP domain-containing sensor histidine kinase, partial [Pseudomonadota bacterium]
ARLEAGQAVVADDVVDLAEVVCDVADLYQPIAEEAGATLTIQNEGAAEVRGHRQLLGQALTNLIENALKYGRPASTSDAHRIDVSLGLAPGEDAKNIRLIVADSGRGIAADDRARALTRFVRLDESRTTQGSGLGLSLVAAIIRAHGGSLALEDNAPGLRIVASFPAYVQRAPHVAAPVVRDPRSDTSGDLDGCDRSPTQAVSQTAGRPTVPTDVQAGRKPTRHGSAPVTT